MSHAHTLVVFEHGTRISEVGDWGGNDVFRVAIENGAVVYRRNGVALLPPRANTHGYPLRASAGFRDPVSGVRNVRIAGALVDLAGWCATGDGERSQGDFDGDGRVDLLCKRGNAFEVRLGTATGFAAATRWLTASLANAGVGDFDGDGKLDVYGINTSSGDVLVARSTGAGFTTPASWGANAMCSLDTPFRLLTGDFNRDGRTDVACQRLAGDPRDGVWVGISTGASFVHTRWLAACGLGHSAFAMDLDGDGRDDLACLDAHGAVDVNLSTGSSFDGAGLIGSYILAGQCDWDQWQAGDYNGDGKTDLLCANTGQIFLSAGHTFAAQPAAGGFCVGDRDQVVVGDVDGDGIADQVCNHADAPANDIEVRLGTGTGFVAATTWRGAWCLGGVVAADLDGDRKTDLYCDESPQPIAHAGTAGAMVGLMTAWANGLGGTTAIGYAPSTIFPSTNNPPVVAVVVSLATSDGRGGTAASTFQYDGGLIDRVERRFLGFAHQREVQPCDAAPCPKRDLYFLQDYGSLSKVKRDERRDGLGRLLDVAADDYATNGAQVPYTCLRTGSWHYAYGDPGGPGGGAVGEPAFQPCQAGVAGCKASHSSYEYDAYGNLRRAIDDGDIDLAGDERRVERQFYPNLVAFIVDRPGWESWMSGASGGQLLRQTIFLYDGSSIWDQPPQQGYQTAALRWHDVSNSFVQAQAAYDASGNRTSITDETGLIATTEWDTARLFPIRAVDVSGDATTTTWDATCGAPATVTDASGQATSYQRDALCRTTRVDRPLGNFTRTSYVAFGDPSAQLVRTVTPLPGGRSLGLGVAVATRFVDEYFDGLGRTYRTSSSGPAAAQTIETTQSYDASGAVMARSAPYYGGAAPQVTHLEHDALGRTTAKVFPDATRLTTRYDAWATISVDGHGHQTIVRGDAFGRAIAEDRSHDGATLSTRRDYDRLGNLTAITDPAGNRIAWTFDSLGRVVALSDPDLGHRSASYDAAGRPLALVDAKGQTTSFSYAGGRVATRTTADGTTTLAYGEARAGFFNAGRLTRMDDPGTQVLLDYDAQGRAVRITRSLEGVSYVVSRTFAPAGEPLTLTYPDGDAIGTFTYDGAGRLTAIPGVVNALTYDAAGRPLQQTNANGTQSSWTYSAARGWLDRVVTAGPVPVQDLAYTHDPDGQVTHVAGPFAHETVDYAYDDLHRVTDAAPTGDTAEHYAYDAAGNLTFNSRVGAYTYPSPGSPRPHAPTAIAGAAITYDANGNLVAGRGRHVSWTADDRPAAIDGVTFRYDGDGSRVKMQSSASVSVTPLGDLYEIRDGVITKQIGGPGGLVVTRTGGETFWLHRDRLGSINAVTDRTGAVVKRSAYSAYGDVRFESGAHVEPHQYIGQRRDAETGLMYLHARSYDPLTGLFLSADPSHPAAPGVGTNRYAYARGNPIARIDPSGLADGPPPVFPAEVIACPNGNHDPRCRNYYPPEPWFLGDSPSDYFQRSFDQWLRGGGGPPTDVEVNPQMREKLERVAERAYCRHHPVECGRKDRHHDETTDPPEPTPQPTPGPVPPTPPGGGPEKPEQSTQPGSGDAPGPSTPKKTGTNWGKVFREGVHVGVVGGVGGASGGFVAGWLGGPPGAGTGALLGLVAGGVGGFVGGALDEAGRQWNWWGND